MKEHSEKIAIRDVDKTNVISIKAGVYTAFGLILYFLVMRLLNLHHYLILHYLNIFILFFGLRYAIKNIKSFNGDIKYFEGLKSGVVVSIIAIFIFNIFWLFYETVFEPAFLVFLSEKISLGHIFSAEETIIDVMGIITIEGLSSGFILTYILMQFYKSNNSEND